MFDAGAVGAGAVMVGDEHDSGELVWEDAKDEQVPAQSGRSDYQMTRGNWNLKYFGKR